MCGCVSVWVILSFVEVRNPHAASCRFLYILCLAFLSSASLCLSFALVKLSTWFPYLRKNTIAKEPILILWPTIYLISEYYR